MKTIGLLGGTAWISTIEYYRQLNQKVQKRLGGHHSAKIVLNSIDYNEIKKYNYQDWPKIEEVLMNEILKLANFEIDCILICNNTLHKAYEEIEPHLYIDVPVIHIVDCVGEFAQSKKFKNLLLLGTQFTMEDGFYRNRLEEKFDMKVSIPNPEDRKEIQRITQEELAKEKFTAESKCWFQKLVDKYPCDAVVLGCTELPLLIKPEDYAVPILNTLELHCQKAVDFALSE